MANVNGGAITRATTKAPSVPQKSVTVLMNELLDQNSMRKRFNELLGKRAPQFISSMVSLVNADANLQQVFQDAPMTIIQAAMKAATFDLPIDPSLGYAYIVPFKNKQKEGPPRMEASFIMGYKGQMQLALRTGAYNRINVVDVREGELLHYDRLTEDIDIQFIEDEDERAKLPIVGWCGYFRLVNGMEKKIYMTRKQIEQHEKKNRKGQWMGKGWRDNFEAMAEKTVLRKLLGKWGVMSIDYQTATPAMVAAAEAIVKGDFDDENKVIEAEAQEVPENVNPETGEIVNGLTPEEQAAADKVLEEAMG